MFENLRNKSSSRNSVAPMSDVIELISNEESKYDNDYIMPSLPMKFSFNRLYILSNNQEQQLTDKSVNYSLKAIFSKNANKLQRKRRNLIIGIFAAILLVIIALILVIIIVVILNKESATSLDESATNFDTTIYSSLVNDLIGLDNTRIASSSLDGFISIWNVATRSAIKTWQAHSNPIKITKLNDGSILSGSLDPASALKIWNGNTGALIKIFSASASQVTSLLAIEDQGLILSGHLDSTIKIWNSTTGLTAKPTLIANNGGIYKLLQLNNRDLIASGAVNGAISIWNIATNSLVLTTTNIHTDIVKSLIQLDNDYMLSGSLDSYLKVWEISSGTVDTQVYLGTNKVECMLDLSNNKIAYGTQEKIWILDYVANANPNTFPLFLNAYSLRVTNSLSGHTSKVNALIKLNNRLVSGSNDGTIRFWNV